jgi:hypothetical protein
MKYLSSFAMFLTLVAGGAFAADTPLPYLGVSNATDDWSVTVDYMTATQPAGKLVIEPHTASGIPVFPEGEEVSVQAFHFKNNSSGITLPEKNWCPEILPQKRYNWVSVQVTQAGSSVNVTCSGIPSS